MHWKAEEEVCGWGRGRGAALCLPLRRPVGKTMCGRATGHAAGGAALVEHGNHGRLQLRMEMEPPGLAGFSKVTASAFRA